MSILARLFKRTAKPAPKPEALTIDTPTSAVQKLLLEIQARENPSEVTIAVLEALRTGPLSSHDVLHSYQLRCLVEAMIGIIRDDSSPFVRDRLRVGYEDLMLALDSNETSRIR